ncbi:MAG: hypothetical protein R3280_15820 [Marinobacter sp.]|uniref:hypothetical protein n=1 Tax=Marinobacter sp. TaxID=50741 RepID=UPI00299DA2B0|nr:hypothetical protein [Marinobacter sp.]MDX1636106.1 hypothetical protein [Marinobacter sp.]
MQVSKRDGRVLDQAIRHWQEDAVISEAEAGRLRAAYQVTPFDWKRLARYAFWLALASVLISVSSALADEWLVELFRRLFTAPDAAKCLGLAAIAGGLFYTGIRRKRRHPGKIYSNEALFFLGVVATAAAVGYLGRVIDTGSGHFSLLLLLAAVIYGLLGLWFPSKLVWIFSLLSLGAWFGAETGYASGWGAYYLGMNYPMRFVLFGLVLIAGGSWLFRHWQARQDFQRPTRAMGLLYLFIALWIMSIFGNYGDPEAWERARQIELLHWSVLFAVAALAAIFHGVNYDDAMTRGFGLTFLFINLYTRFFEYFWDSTHKALFFAILGVSFWYLGSRAERIWELSLVRGLKREG